MMNPASTNGRVRIKIVAGDDASGLANIIAQYLEQVLEDSAEKRAEASALEGRLGLQAREGDVAVTIVFAGDSIEIEEGLRDPDAVIGGELEFLMHVMAGKANPAWEMLTRKMTIGLGVQRPMFAYQAYSLMRLPGVHVWDGMPRPPRGLLAGASAVLLAVAAIWLFQRKATGGSDA